MDATDYLQFRERLKEDIRNKKKKVMMQEQQISPSFSLPTATKLPYEDSYGSFFGPSEPSIAVRVLEETKSLLQNPSSSKPANTKKLGLKLSKTKAQVLKHSRDYSFLSSDGDPAVKANSDSADSKSDSCGSTSSMESGKVLEPNSENRHITTQVKDKPLKGLGEQSESCSKSRKGLKMKTKAHGLKPAKTAAQVQKYARDYSFLSTDSALPQNWKLSGNKSNMMSTSQKENGPVQCPSPNNLSSNVLKSPSADPVVAGKRNVGKSLNGLAKSPGPKNLYSKASIPSCGKSSDERKQIVGKNPNGTVQSSGLKGGKAMVREKQVISTKPRHGTEKLRHIAMKEAWPKKRRREECLDDDVVGPEEISRMIRGMYNYNPYKYGRDDRDDFNMEASYREIQKEERRSAKLAKKEDAEELEKIMEEEKREKMMKKKLKT